MKHYIDEMEAFSGEAFFDRRLAKEQVAIHLLAGSSAAKFIAFLRKNCPDLLHRKKFRTRLAFDTALGEDIKFKFYRAYCLGRGSRHEQLKLARRFNLDNYIIDLFNEDKYPELHVYLKTLAEKYKPLSFSRFQLYFSRVIQEQKGDIQGFVIVKLTYLRSYGYDIQDTINHISSKAYQYIYSLYPKIDGYTHLTNLYRKQARNAGNKLCHYFNCTSRNHIVDGQSMQLSLTVLTEDGEFGDSDCGALASYLAVDGMQWYSAHVDSVLDKLSPVQLDMLSILSGCDNLGFSEWMAEKNKRLYNRYEAGNRDLDILCYILQFLDTSYASFFSCVTLLLDLDVSKVTQTIQLKALN